MVIHQRIQKIDCVLIFESEKHCSRNEKLNRESEMWKINFSVPKLTRDKFNQIKSQFVIHNHWPISFTFKWYSYKCEFNRSYFWILAFIRSVSGFYFWNDKYMACASCNELKKTRNTSSTKYHAYKWRLQYRWENMKFYYRKLHHFRVVLLKWHLKPSFL